MWYACDLNSSSHILTRRSVKNNIVDFVDDFWRSSFNWTERGASHADVQLRLNSFIQLYTVANAGANVHNMQYEHIQLGFDFFRR